MASDVEICNRAAQILGASRIASLSDGSATARELNAAYGPARLAELRKHPWNFAIKRELLAADATAPIFGRARAFTLPSLCLRVLPPYPEDNMQARDWTVEGRQILTDDSAPLPLRYVSDITDANEMDATFREALAGRIAFNTCERITQSNSKLEAAAQVYKDAIREARRANAIENVPQVPAEDEWITARA